MAMIGSGVGIVLAFMLGMDAGLCPADSSAAQAHGQYPRLAAPKFRLRAAQTKRQSGFQCTESREHLPYMAIALTRKNLKREAESTSPGQTRGWFRIPRQVALIVENIAFSAKKIRQEA